MRKCNNNNVHVTYTANMGRDHGGGRGRGGRGDGNQSNDGNKRIDNIELTVP